MKTMAERRLDGQPSGKGRFMRIDDVIATVSLSRATIYRMIAIKDFPAQHQLTKRSIGWWQSDIDSWLQSRLSPCERSD